MQDTRHYTEKWQQFIHIYKQLEIDLSAMCTICDTRKHKHETYFSHVCRALQIDIKCH